jgi:pyrimidine-nucleoside phosphorylase
VNLLPLIEAKRDRRKLSAAEIRGFITHLPSLPDYQVAAFLMAVFFRGLDAEETTALTLAMRDSGDVLKFPSDPRPLVDKHSTGGVGDKVSLPLAPLLACLGFRVPMISGRSLGITGGTLDKLESIPGFKTALPGERIKDIVQTVGCVICGQTERMVPADRRLYALRDITGTVPSLSLITASILSKKLAEGLDSLVLDVKFGCAAFMQTEAEARELAQAMATLGQSCGVNTRALLTDMNTPLGHAAGNWLEVKESVTILNDAPADRSDGLSDVRELVLACAAHLLVQTRKAPTYEAGFQKAADCLASGAPRRKWDEMLVAQGADLAEFEHKLGADHIAPSVAEIHAERNGFVSRCDARIVGEIIRELGGSRLSHGSVITHDVGVDRLAKPGESVRAGDVLARIHAADGEQATAAASRMRSAFQIGSEPPATRPRVAQVLCG